MAPSKKHPENSPPVSSDKQADDVAGEVSMELIWSATAADAAEAGAGKDVAESSRRTPARAKSGSKRVPSDMTATGKDEGKAAKKKKKKTTEAVAVHGDGVGTPVVVPASIVVDEDEGKKSFGGRVFSAEDDIVILEKVIHYRVKRGLEPSSNPGEFFDFVKGSLHAEVTKRQLIDKTRSLQKKFNGMVDRFKKGKEYAPTAHDVKVFELSKQIWGMQGTDGINPVESNANPILKQSGVNEKVGNVGNNVAEGDKVDKETNGGVYGIDDFWTRFAYLKNGVEMMVSLEGFSDFRKKLLLEKVKGFGGAKAKEWNRKWKAMCMEEMQLRIRKLDLVARFSEAVLEELKK